MEGRLHHPPMPQVDWLFVGEQSRPQHFAHTVKANALDEGRLLSDGHLVDHRRGEQSDKQLAVEEERRRRSVGIPQI